MECFAYSGSLRRIGRYHKPRQNYILLQQHTRYWLYKHHKPRQNYILLQQHTHDMLYKDLKPWQYYIILHHPTGGPWCNSMQISEDHTSVLHSQRELYCRLLLE